MAAFFTKKNVQIIGLIGLILSFFLPWYRVNIGTVSLFQESEGVLEFAFKELVFFPPLYGFEFGVWETIMGASWYFFGGYSLFMPLLAVYMIYRLLNNKSTKVVNIILLTFTILILLTYLNRFIYFLGEGSNIQVGMLICIVGTIILLFSGSIASKMREDGSKQMSTCSHCSEEISAGQKFCTHCGERII